MTVRISEVHSDAVVLSDLCNLAARIACEEPSWELSAPLVATAHLAERVADRLDRHSYEARPEVHHAAA